MILSAVLLLAAPVADLPSRAEPGSELAIWLHAWSGLEAVEIADSFAPDSSWEFGPDGLCVLARTDTRPRPLIGQGLGWLTSPDGSRSVAFHPWTNPTEENRAATVGYDLQDVDLYESDRGIHRVLLSLIDPVHFGFAQWLDAETLLLGDRAPSGVRPRLHRVDFRHDRVDRFLGPDLGGDRGLEIQLEVLHRSRASLHPGAAQAASTESNSPETSDPCPDETRIRRHYLRQPAHSGVEFLSTLSAAAILGNLGETWVGPCPLGRSARGYFSPRSEYCFILWGCTNTRHGHRACLLDSCGNVAWTNAVEWDGLPTVSDYGTVALLTVGEAPDTTKITFRGPDGSTRGTYRVPSKDLAIPSQLTPVRRKFVPESEDLVILGTGQGTWGDEREWTLRLVSPAGAERWRADLGPGKFEDVRFSPSGSTLVVIEADRSDGPLPGSITGRRHAQDPKARSFALSVYRTTGELVAKVSGECIHGPGAVYLDDTGILYYWADRVLAYDVERRERLDPPPLAPLIRAGRLNDPERVGSALNLRSSLQESAGPAD